MSYNFPNLRPWEANLGSSHPEMSPHDDVITSGFTVVTMTYKRSRLLPDLIRMFDGVKELREVK